MKRMAGLAALGVLLAAAGSLMATPLLPEEGGEGFWGDPTPLEGDSWGFKIDYGPGYYNALTCVQARVVPLGSPDQYLEDTHLDPGGHDPLVKGGGNPAPIGWTNCATYDDVVVLSGGNDLQGGYQYFTAWFGLGTVNNYVVTGSPAFALQLQAYGYDVRDPAQTIGLLDNEEFYFDGTAWAHYYYNGMAHASQSGTSGAGIGAWTATSIVPEPLTATGLLLGIGCLGRYLARRRREG